MKYLSGRRSGGILFLVLMVYGAASCTRGPAVSPSYPEGVQSSLAPASADDFLVVDCLLPGQIRRIGLKTTYVTPRRPVKTTAVDCAIRGGEYVAYDRANYQTARRIWESKAQEGDKEAQNYLGEIYEKGLGIKPDYLSAAAWYRRAAEQGYAPAQINLGKLYEAGLGVPRDMEKALNWYRRASGLTDLQPDPSLSPAPPPAPARDKEKGEGPVIQMIEPAVQSVRGVAVLPVQIETPTRPVVGKVIAPNGLLTLTVNGREINVADKGIFKTDVPVQGSGTEILIAAVDKAGMRTELRLRLNPVEPLPEELDFGSYYALVIGNNDYRYLPDLVTARADAAKVSEILERKYGFKVVPLYDANRYRILDALNTLRKTLTEKDNLLIYYAGHGDLDRANDRGHWLPVDAERESTANWISNVALTDILNIMSSRHILVIADSCYSGTLTRSVLTQLRPGMSDEVRTTYYRTVLAKRSRTALTSGGVAPVLDTGSGGHSVFAGVLITVLQSNREILEGQRLFLDLAALVTHEAYKRKFEQMPQYAPIKFSGHEAGDFFLVPAI